MENNQNADDDIKYGVDFSLSQMKELKKILRGHSHSVHNRIERGVEVPPSRVVLIEQMLSEVSETLLDVEMYSILGTSLCDDSVEETLNSWRNF